MIVDFLEHTFKSNIFCKRLRNFSELSLFFIDGIVTFKSALSEEEKYFYKTVNKFCSIQFKVNHRDIEIVNIKCYLCF